MRERLANLVLWPAALRVPPEGPLTWKRDY
jgi:hypothetical protein